MDCAYVPKWMNEFKGWSMWLWVWKVWAYRHVSAHKSEYARGWVHVWRVYARLGRQRSSRSQLGEEALVLPCPGVWRAAVSMQGMLGHMRQKFAYPVPAPVLGPKIPWAPCSLVTRTPEGQPWAFWHRSCLRLTAEEAWGLQLTYPLPPRLLSW